MAQQGPGGSGGPGGIGGGKGPIGGQGSTGSAGSPSDRRLKTNLRPINEALLKVLKLRGVSFYWREFFEGKPTNADLTTQELGVIAQEVELYFPELVAYTSSGIRTVKYDMLVAVLTEAIQQQSGILDEKEIELRQLEKIAEDRGLI